MRLLLLVATTYVVLFTVTFIFFRLAESSRSYWLKIGLPLAFSMAGVFTVMMFSRIYSLKTLFSAYPFTTPKPLEMGIALLMGFAVASIQVAYTVRFCDGAIGLPHMVGVITLIPGAFFEELFFRGALYDGLRTRFSVGWTFVIILIVFAAMHQKVALDPLWVLCATFINFGLCWVRWKFNNLWTCIAAHWMHNVILLFVGGNY